jgi:hypothetical protein
MKYIGTARNVRELMELLSKIDPSATITLSAIPEPWSYLEVWYDQEINDIEIK